MLDAPVIKRAVILLAPRGPVWKALTEPEQLVKWFGTDVSLEPREGGKISFGWGDAFRFPGIIESFDPPTKLVFRWRSYEGDAEISLEEMATTRVIFTLEEVAQGTRLSLTETGFAALPENLRDMVLDENRRGWDKKLQDLEAYINALAQVADWAT